MSMQLSPQIVEQAAGWFARFRAGEVPAAESEEFLRWLQRSPEHVQAYIEEALSYSDELPLTTCARLTNRGDEPCSTVRSQVRRDGGRRCRQK
jgi:ferric-dicitrate binding protein FerR (iron transport regulator)